LTIGEIFVASQVNDLEALQPLTPLEYRSGRLLSMDRIAGTRQEKARLHATGAAAVEMEAAALASRAREWRMPFFCVRAVSDTAVEGFRLDLNEMRDTEGRFSRQRIIIRALKNPLRLVPELLRLNRNSGRAAKALGDFFANCSF
jgi:adenosylhomocysteine nucleosidase